MNIVKTYPPNIEKIKKVFPLKRNTVYTYGDTIYAPEIYFTLPPDLLIHEGTHQVQQAMDPELWWDLYIKDKEFRFKQELEAYRNQYRFYKDMAGRQQSRRFLRIIASDLSSDLYGKIVDKDKALELIKG